MTARLSSGGSRPASLVAVSAAASQTPAAYERGFASSAKILGADTVESREA